jgi:hypothetical protein
MPTIKQILRDENPQMFDERQASLMHEIYIVGLRKKNAEGKNTSIIEYLQKSKPNTAASAAGIKSMAYVHSAMLPVGTMVVLEDGTLVMGGPKSPQVDVIFQSNSPLQYQFIKDAIEKGLVITEAEAEKKNAEIATFNANRAEGVPERKLVVANPQGGYFNAGFDKLDRPIIKLRNKLFGRIIAINVPAYTPHSMNEVGKMVPLAPTTYDPATGKYTTKPVTMSSLKFFADDDDLDLLLEVCARQVSKRVLPFIAKKITVTEEDATGSKKVTVKEPELEGNEEASVTVDAEEEQTN